MNIDMGRLHELITQAMADPSSGDSWLEERYAECIPHHLVDLYYKLFYLIAKEFRPRFSVELGAYRAVASGHLAAGNPEGLVYTVDMHHEDKISQQRTKDMAAHFKNLTYINGRTCADCTAVQIASVAMVIPIDLLFIDSWHYYETAIREWEIYSPMLADEALVICDDIDDSIHNKDMIKFWNEISAGCDGFLNVGLHRDIPLGFMRYTI